jgi:2-polyprenyl-3-methyl-5-hydroxy-6-metoxy-1,4-benzoquinol methylase
MKIKSLGRAGDAGATEHYADASYYTKTYKERTHDVEYYVKRARRSKGPVLEYGIGNGRVALAIAKAGISVTGIDLSQRLASP